MTWPGYWRKKSETTLPQRQQEETLREPPTSFPLTVNAVLYLQERLHLIQEEGHLAWNDFPKPPAQILETSLGILFHFPNSNYWQERRWDNSPYPKWKSAGPNPPPYLTGTHGDTLFVVEGIFDALAIHREGEIAAAVLTNIPRYEMLSPLHNAFSQVVWIPDGDLPLATRLEGLERLRLLWPGATGISLAPGEDPSSLDPQTLKRRLNANKK